MHCCYDHAFKEVSRVLIDVMMVMTIIKMTVQKTAVFMLIYCGSGVAIKHFISTSVTVRNYSIYSVIQAFYNTFALKKKNTCDVTAQCYPWLRYKLNSE